ncbi:6-phosphofructokinase, partial [Enterobacter sp. R1(2018)]|uniref:6-phosphofructokinase n=1 Tax=Enterobacter sp. R1(2018) TaxID=2447891 RepID=UPI00217E41EF
MRIGMVISGGDVTGINNFVFQVSRLAQAEIVLFNGGIPGLLQNKHQAISLRDLVDFSIASIPIMSSGRTNRKLTGGEYETIAKQLKALHIDVLIMAGGDGS